MSIKIPQNLLIIGAVVAALLAGTILLGNYANIVPCKSYAALQVKAGQVPCCPAESCPDKCCITCPQAQNCPDKCCADCCPADCCPKKAKSSCAEEAKTCCW